MWAGQAAGMGKRRPANVFWGEEWTWWKETTRW